MVAPSSMAARHSVARRATGRAGRTSSAPSMKPRSAASKSNGMSPVVGQGGDAVASGRPGDYNETRRIWEENGVYSRYFSDRTSARHVVFAFSLLRALEAAKKRIADIPEADRTE